MPKNTTLAERLKQQHSREKEIIQDLTQEQLQNLRNELKSTYSKELATIKNDMEKQNQTLGWKLLRNRILLPLAVSLSLCVGLFLGSWGIMQYMTSRIMEMNQNLEVLEQAGGKVKLGRCGAKNLYCVQIDEEATQYEDGYRIIKEN